MPAIQVAKTDTFESQRQKINQIGSQVFSITQGGSDLATGNLKLGDGSRTIPSLSFTTDSSLGLYKSSLSSLGFVYDGKKLVDAKDDSFVSYKDIFVQKNILINSGISITNTGSYYENGTYPDVPLKSGSGTGATANIEVVGFSGTITNAGENYVSGTYSVNLVGGSGSDAEASLSISDFVFNILNTGSNYGGAVDGNGDPITTYQNVPLLGGSGSGAVATITLDPSTGAVDFVTITDNGQNYVSGDLISVDNQYLNNQGSGFQIELTETPGSATALSIVNYGTGYQPNDVLTTPTYQIQFSNIDLKGSVNGVSTTLSDASAVITVADTTGILAGMEVTSSGTGSVAFGTTVQSVDSSTQLTLSAIPDVAGAATLDFTSTGDLSSLILPSVAGILDGSIVEVTGGTGAFSSGTKVATVDPSTNTVFLTQQPLLAGTADIQFIPPWGQPTTQLQYTIQNVGVVQSVVIADPGNGYAVGDLLTASPSDLVEDISYQVYVRAVQKLTFTGTIAAGAINSGDQLEFPGGEIATVNITSSTTIPGEANNSYNITSTTTNGIGTEGVFFVTRDGSGAVDSVQLQTGGKFYSQGDTITISGSDVGGGAGDNIVLQVATINPSLQSITAYKVITSGGNIQSIFINDIGIIDLDYLKVSGGGTNYQVASTQSSNKYFIDSGSGEVMTPDLTLYSGNTYIFDSSDSTNSGHPFAFSKFADGNWSPSLVENVSTTLSSSSNQITVTSTANILPGMEVTVVSGGAFGQTPYVDTVIDSTTLTLTETPLSSGSAVLSFSGVEYTEAVIRGGSTLQITINDDTPNLYYYCQNHPDMGGDDGEEGLLTVDVNNPRVFGSGLEITVTQIDSTNIIKSYVDTGLFESVSGSFVDITATTASLTDITSSTLSSSTSLSTPLINSPQSTLTIDTDNLQLSTNVSIGSSFSINETTGELTTSGYLKTTDLVNVNDVLKIQNNNIFTTAGYDVVITPNSGRVAKVSASSAFVIPVGTDAERPGAAIRENGSIRFNTTSNQYEGYSASTQSWSSLGGVRDIDGNTYILAELSAGANDNTLWFFNDSINTLKLTRDFLDFRSAKKISSGRLGLPTFSVWTANTPVSIGQYVKYKNNLYEVTASGTTASSGGEPTHTSGVANNGTAQFTWYSLSVSPITFEEVQELRVGPSKDCPLIVSSETKIFNNEISTLVEDLVLSPNSGKKVTINSSTSLVIPVGNTNQRESAATGSIRFNTTISQFEGYSGTNWSSLGGVRDVDGNTYIIPETAPAANENILYFYNDGTNTLQLSSTGLDFTNIDTITTSGGNTLAINTNIVTLDNSATTIDNTNSTSSFISTTKQYLDLGLSSGLNVDPVLRLDDQGDVYLNTGFGTGTFSGVKIFDGDLKDFELADYLVKTSVLSLIKGTSNSGAVVLYDTSSAKGCRVTVVSKSSTGKKSMVEYNVIDNGTDIFHNEFGSLNTSADGFEASFDITPSNETRITLTLSDDHATNDTVEITVLIQVVK